MLNPRKHLQHLENKNTQMGLYTNLMEIAPILPKELGRHSLKFADIRSGPTPG